MFHEKKCAITFGWELRKVVDYCKEGLSFDTFNSSSFQKIDVEVAIYLVEFLDLGGLLGGLS